MASSGVEIASSSPFGCVLRDRNHRDGCRESNVYQKNIKNFVMGHLNTCISMPSDSAPNEKSNNNNKSPLKVSKNNNLGNLRLTRINQNNGKNNNKDKEKPSLASLVSPRHTRLLDRWAARQAREMVSTLENEAELLAMPNSNSNKDNDMLASTCSNSSYDDVASENSILGASSLVQIWEKRLNQSNGSKPTTLVSANALLEDQNRGGSEAGESPASPSSSSSSNYESPRNEEQFSDWESDKMSLSEQSSPQARFSSTESAERDRVSVLDIIKRLTTTNQGQSPSNLIGDENDREGWSSSVTCSPRRERDPGSTPEQPFLPQVTCLPRIRGRQAFHDLLMQLERDRHAELNNLADRGAVSKFTQRGRIQAVLRLRLLQRGVAANDQSRKKSTLSEEVNRQIQGSAIMQLRERFSTGVVNRTATRTEVAETRNNPPIQFDASTSTNQPSKDTCSLTVDNATNCSPECTQKQVSQTREEARPSSDAKLQETYFEVQYNDTKEIAKATPSMTTDSNLNVIEDKVGTSNQQCTMAKTNYDEIIEEEEESSNQHYAESCYDDEIVDEDDDIDMNYYETNYDWISEISRPRSYWEERRQAWYTEMLHTESHNDDIRELLERRTVSTFLSSDFRDRMDRLMESHKGTQIHLEGRLDEEEGNQALMAFLEERLHPASSPPEEERERREEQEEEEERQNEEEEEEAEAEVEDRVEEQEGDSLISNSFHEVADYFNQPSSPTHLTTWSYRDNETNDDFDRVASISSPPSHSQSFCRDSRRHSSSTNHHSIEMELIYELRGHMEQLYHEMSELRKSMKTCMDMQMQLQQSKIQEVYAVKKEEIKTHNKAPKKGNCCICYEMKVDSLLYRCGHMCTCLKCANELQWNSGKCPICRAKIVDVVRVYVDF